MNSDSNQDNIINMQQLPLVIQKFFKLFRVILCIFLLLITIFLPLMDFYPNIKRLLLIFATIPVTTCTSERSFSSLKRIKTYLRSTMGENRLNGLALLNIHPEIIINTEEVVDIYANKHPRRLQLL